MRKQAWEVGKPGHAPGHGRPRRAASPAPPRAPNPRGRCSLEVWGERCLPTCVCAGATCTLTMAAPPPRSRVHTPPACMEGLALENTLVSPHTPLTPSHPHTHTHTHVSCARVPSFAPVSSSLSHLLDCSLLLPRTLMERGVILQVLTHPAQSTCAPHLPVLWPLYRRRPCPGSSPSTLRPFLLPGPPMAPRTSILSADAGIWECPRCTGRWMGLHPREQE